MNALRLLRRRRRAKRQPIATLTVPMVERCTHPEEDRIDAARMGKPNAFICKRCGHRED